MDRHSKEFKKLQQHWDQVLKENGFEDAEHRNSTLHGHDELKSWHASLFRLSTKTRTNTYATREAKEEYYRAAGHFLYDFPFKHAVDRRVWELHSQGTARLAIVHILRQEGLWYGDTLRKMTGKDTPVKFRKRKDSRPCSYSVQLIIERLEAEMIKRINNDRNNSQT